jgi:hypothetical protein
MLLFNYFWGAYVAEYRDALRHLDDKDLEKIVREQKAKEEARRQHLKSLSLFDRILAEFEWPASFEQEYRADAAQQLLFDRRRRKT